MASRFWAWNRNASVSRALRATPTHFPRAPFIHTNHTKPNTSRRRLDGNGRNWVKERGEGTSTGFPLSASRLNITGKIAAEKSDSLSIRNKGTIKKKNRAREVAKRENRSWLDYKTQVATDAAPSTTWLGNLCREAEMVVLCEGLTLTAEPYVYPVCAEIWLWAMDIVEQLIDLAPREGRKKGCHGCAEGWGRRVLLSQLRVSCAAKFTSSQALFLSAPPCCCSGPFLITSFAKQKTKKAKKEKRP